MDRWEQIENAYHGARDLGGEDRSRFLNEQCGSDGAMRQQIEALLAQDENFTSFLSPPEMDLATDRKSIVGTTGLIGLRIGAYEVLEPIGAGGMGEVYRARDSKLDREVALKFLPVPVRTDPDRLARFAREARTLAALNHPNIGAIYGLEESDGLQALVLELIEGPTLADRIAQGPVPIIEALPIARQISDAIAAAHEQGIIHRDLKPANIKLRPDGTVKVLDFGLAKALEATRAGGAGGLDPSASPTISLAVTGMGVILGTAAYMSPEQAKGRAIDTRCDVWAFGCVLYEMLTGTRAFAGEDVSDTLAAVLRGEPDWTRLPAAWPPSIRTLIEGCLTRDRKECIADISTVRFLLNEKRVEGAAVQEIFARRQSPWKRVSMFVAIAAVAAAIGALAVWSVKSTTNQIASSITRFAITLSDDQQFTNPGRQLLAISPDGKQVVYVANNRLYLRSLSELEARPILGTESAGGVTSPVFSPDGRFVAFGAAADRSLKRIAVGGGTPTTICDACGLFGMTWGPDGILFGQESNGIMHVAAEGGNPELLFRVKNGELAYGPQALPDGRGTLFTLASGAGRGPDLWDRARIVVQMSKGSEPKTLIEGASDARYLPTGHIVYAIQGRLFAVPFDLRDLTVTGKPVPVIDGVERGGATGVAQFSVSSSGSLVYVPGPTSISTLPQFRLALLDASGRAEILKLPAAAYESPRVSPDGKQLAVGVVDDKETNIWIYDLEGTSAIRRFTFGGRERFPVWSTDGRYVAFQSEREGELGIFWQRADFSGTPERLTKPDPGTAHVPESWSPRGDVFTYSVYSYSRQQGSGGRFTLASFSIQDKQSHTFAGVRSTYPLASEFSRDGRWLAYGVSDKVVGTAQATVFVEPFPSTGAKYQISEARRGFHPTWLPDGKKLSYSTGVGSEGPQWVAVNITMQPRFTIGNAVKVSNGGLIDSVLFVFVKGPFGFVSERNYDFTPDGKRVGIVRADAFVPARSGPIQVVLNWFEELKERVPVR